MRFLTVSLRLRMREMPVLNFWNAMAAKNDIP